MTAVGIREFKAHLSSYVQRAEAGEAILITDRGRPVAQLNAAAPAKSVLEELIAAGVARRAVPGSRPTPKPLIEAGPVSDLVADQRG